MKMKMKLTVAAAIAAVAGIASAQDMVVKIGHVAPMSGAQAHYGKDNENGVRMAIEDLNAQGVTIGGKKIKFEIQAEDDAADPKQGTAAAQKLCDAQGRRRGRPPELGHHHPRLQGLQRLRHSPRHRRGHQPRPDQARLQDHLPHHRQRQCAGRGLGSVRGRHAQAQEGRHHRRPHGLRPGRCRSVQEDGRVQGHAGRGRAVHDRQGHRFHGHPDVHQVQGTRRHLLRRHGRAGRPDAAPDGSARPVQRQVLRR